MPYIAMGMVSFSTQGNADFIFNQAKSVAVSSSVANIGLPGERTSYFGVYEEMPDGTLVPIRLWYMDTFGIVREGVTPDTEMPVWIQPTGAQDAYPANDIYGNVTKVFHNDKVWVNTFGATNTYEPGVFGWTEVPQEGGVEEPDPEPEGYPDWLPWTSGLNEDLYQVGDRVNHNGSDWEATVGNNHWQPGVFGWVQI